MERQPRTEHLREAYLLRKNGRPSVADRLRAGLVRDPSSGCLLWSGSKKTTGHGQISIATSKPESVHRVAWIIERGEIPGGLSVFHRCSELACCNTEHLFVGKSRSNLSISERIEKWSMPEPNSGCWLWLANTGGKGRYGKLTCNRRQRQAHAASWEAHNGRPVPDGLVVRHRCDVSLCVNPNHLLIGTQADNINDRDSRGRTARGDRHGRSKLRRARANP